MDKLAVIGDRDSVLGFRALGLAVYCPEQPDEARALLHRLAQEGCALIFVTEPLARSLQPEMESYRDSVAPAILPIPAASGAQGLGSAQLKRAVQRAVGAELL